MLRHHAFGTDGVHSHFGNCEHVCCLTHRFAILAQVGGIHLVGALALPRSRKDGYGKTAGEPEQIFTTGHSGKIARKILKRFERHSHALRCLEIGELLLEVHEHLNSGCHTPAGECEHPSDVVRVVLFVLQGTRFRGFGDGGAELRIVPGLQLVLWSRT